MTKAKLYTYEVPVVRKTYGSASVIAPSSEQAKSLVENISSYDMERIIWEDSEGPFVNGEPEKFPYEPVTTKDAKAKVIEELERAISEIGITDLTFCEGRAISRIRQCINTLKGDKQ